MRFNIVKGKIDPLTLFYSAYTPTYQEKPMKTYILTKDCHLIVEKDGKNIFGMYCIAGMKFFGKLRKNIIQGYDLELGEGCTIAGLRQGIMKSN